MGIFSKKEEVKNWIVGQTEYENQLLTIRLQRGVMEQYQKKGFAYQFGITQLIMRVVWPISREYGRAEGKRSCKGIPLTSPPL